MMLCHIIVNSRKLCQDSHLRSWYANQICRLYSRQFYKPQQMFYGYYKCSKGISTGSSSFCKAYESSGENASNSNVKTLENHIKQAGQSAATTLNSIYVIVKNELKHKCISYTYTRTNNNVKCTINVTWPSKESFSAVANSKGNAKNNASLECLNWLSKENKLNGLNPLLYTSESKRNILENQKMLRIDLTSELKYEIKQLIDTYNNEIRSAIMSTPKIKVDEDDLKEDSEANDSLNNTLLHSMKLDNLQLNNRRQENATNLPIINYRQEILNKINNSQVLVIKGETGCGKSTQVPQFIMEEYEKQRKHKCCIIVSEPRRISAISLAARVAKERNETLGHTVGYHVRFDAIYPQTKNSILYCTSGILLRMLEYQNTLKEATHIIIDEAHERSLDIDLLLTLFKRRLKENPHLKLIIMSASINAELFQQYFSSTVVNVPGKLYPVKMHFMEDIEIFNKKLLPSNHCLNEMEISYDNIVSLIKWIIETKPQGGILCFLPGWNEIKTLHEMLKNERMNNLFIVSLHSQVHIVEQQNAFKPPPNNMTKVILSTDVAETGVTIRDVCYVIDTVIKRDIELNKSNFLSCLNYTKISRASITQRKGRAGRVRPGESYHLITREEYEQLSPYTKPEVFKINLEEAIIISKKLMNEKACDFFNSMIEPPSSVIVNNAVKNLQKFGILDDDENFTALGKRASNFSVPLKLSRALIFSSVFQCLDSVLSIITQYFTLPKNELSLNQKVAIPQPFLKQQRMMYHKTSDHIALLHYFQSLVRKNESSLGTWNIRNNDKFIVYLKQVYMLYLNNLLNSRMVSSKEEFKVGNLYSHSYELIRAVLFASTNQLLKNNVFGYKNKRFTNNANQLIAEDNKTVCLYKDSVNYKRKVWPCETLTYIDKVDLPTRNCHMVTDTSMISPLTVLLFSQGEAVCEQMEDNNSNQHTVIHITDLKQININCSKDVAEILLQFRSIIWTIVNYIIEYEGTDDNQNNLKLVKSYKNNMMPLLVKMLDESSKHFDVVDNDDDEYTIKDEESL